MQYSWSTKTFLLYRVYLLGCLATLLFCCQAMTCFQPMGEHTVDYSTSLAGMALDTQDMADYARSHARGLRLTFWLFKTDQVWSDSQHVFK